MNKKIGVGQPKVVENAKILIANTAMDTDKIKIYGSRVRVDSMNKVRRERLERGREKMQREREWVQVGKNAKEPCPCRDITPVFPSFGFLGLLGVGPNCHCNPRQMMGADLGQLLSCCGTSRKFGWC